VERIVGIVLERYPGTDMKEVRARMNQKCRDSVPKGTKRESNSQDEEGGNNEHADNQISLDIE